MRSTCIVLVVLSQAAAAAPLHTSVTRMDFEPSVVIVPETAGATAVDRYRTQPSLAIPALPAGKPLVMLVRLNGANQPDVVSISDARRDGSKITVTIEHRMAMCGDSKNITWIPLVEAELGALAAGHYDVVVDEQVFQFGDGSSCDATKAKPVGHGLGYSGGITVM